MDEPHARTTANLIMAAGAAGAAVIVLRSPTLRRLAWKLATRYAGGPLAVFLATTVHDAWEQSGRRPTVSVR